MKLDIAFSPTQNLRQDSEFIKRAEQLGFDAVWTLESAHNPFFPLTIGAGRTRRILLGAQRVEVISRSPMVTAQIAWDLARQAEGRFMLGLDAQSRPHSGQLDSETKIDIEGRIREYIESLRAIWDTFQTDARLRYRGEYYQFRLMAPFFNPGPITHPDIPIYLAGGRLQMIELAGEICAGWCAHPFHSASYLRDVVWPAADAGLSNSGRDRGKFAVVAPVLIVSGFKDKDRQQAETAARRLIIQHHNLSDFWSVMQYHGWDESALELSTADIARPRDEMAALISEECLNEFAIVAEPDGILDRIESRYTDVADRVCIVGDAVDWTVVEAIARAG